MAWSYFDQIQYPANENIVRIALVMPTLLYFDSRRDSPTSV